MRTALLAALLLPQIAFCSANLGYYIDSSNGATATSQLQTLPTSYAFPDTPVGSAATLIVRVVNNGSTSAQLNVVYVGAAAGSPTATNNFSVTGFQNNATIAPGSFKLFTVNFTPVAIGTSAGYLQGNDGSTSFAIAMFSGHGLAPQLTLSCSSALAVQCTGATLQPNSASALDFGTVATTGTLSIPFTLENDSGTAIDPQAIVAIATTTNNPNTAFALTGLPSTLVAGASVTFNLVFAPGAANTYQTNLLVGSAQYPIRGTGTASAVGDISSLVIAYTDSLGVRLTAQAATAISFGSQVASTASTGSKFTFTVSNPQTSIQSVSVGTLAVTGSAFTLSGAPNLPASIAPGGSITLTVSFLPAAVGVFTGTLTIGTRQFSLTGQGTQSSVSSPTFTLDVQPLVSAKQVHLSISLSSPSEVTTTGTLTLEFTPSAAAGRDDPAIVFLATGSRTLGVTVAQGSQAITYNGETAIGFQSGTTAGTLKLTLAFPNAQTYSQSYTITPGTIQISSATAVSQPPDLVVTMVGYDNTYSAGKMSFTFYDSKGAALLSNPVAVDGTADFQHWFQSSSNSTGGAFSVQLKFPVTGDVTKIANMGIVMTNSVGTTNVQQSPQ